MPAVGYEYYQHSSYTTPTSSYTESTIIYDSPRKRASHQASKVKQIRQFNNIPKPKKIITKS